MKLGCCNEDSVGPLHTEGRNDDIDDGYHKDEDGDHIIEHICPKVILLLV